MKRATIAVVTVALGVAAVVGIQTVVGATAPAPVVGPPAAHDPAVPQIRHDLGVGEHLLLVVGGVYPSEQEADAAEAALRFGEMQGFYITPVSEFTGLAQLFPGQGDWALVSAFRTKEGADQFVTLAQLSGADPVITPRLVSLGGTYAGLGQEAAPDGSGPLDHATRASRPVIP